MFCSASANNGIVHLAGPIQPSEVTAITAREHFPLSFAFAQRTTIPTIFNSKYIEDYGNSCSYRGKVYNLENIQICSVLHKGYKLPSDTDVPVAECILSYRTSNIDKNSPTGILVCFPIYDTGAPLYDGYLDQIVTDSEIGCGYENQVGKTYDGETKRTIEDTSLRKCIKSCCDDAQCLAYTFGGGKCHIKHSIPNLLSTGDATVSGKIKRDQKPACSASGSSSSSSANSFVFSLESLFYQKNGSTTHSIIAYTSCFETTTHGGSLSSRQSLYVLYLPKGIHMRSASYQELILRMNGTLQPYHVPPVMRNDDYTLSKFRMNGGNKEILEYSPKGELYTTTISTCTEEFRKRFEYFRLPPRPSKQLQSARGSSQSGNTSSKTEDTTGQCKMLTTEQYKCVPFNEATDLKGNIVIPGNTTMADILNKQKEAKSGGITQMGGELLAGLSTDDIEAIIGGTIGGILLAFIVYRGVTYFFNRPSN